MAIIYKLHILPKSVVILDITSDIPIEYQYNCKFKFYFYTKPELSLFTKCSTNMYI